MYKENNVALRGSWMTWILRQSQSDLSLSWTEHCSCSTVSVFHMQVQFSATVLGRSRKGGPALVVNNLCDASSLLFTND